MMKHRPTRRVAEPDAAGLGSQRQVIKAATWFVLGQSDGRQLGSDIRPAHSLTAVFDALPETIHHRHRTDLVAATFRPLLAL